ncbi:uncharacterized protein B0H18DRAFT_1113126 [Fomitopsis serialis]|uniref:uncharacterized protein n=1 Tax=Fomitopsis serialis TaxID=139415 RepID=UPI002007A472|nr:uncharacterized protein B0H18DRAFT_1113126 [Neoantrodia serialis]KAH9937269.1 hypothetical protein B0H18DRAFT_1113126 [Neoantrodia serialis]
MRPTTRSQAGAPAPGPVEDVPVQGAINNIEQVFEVESMKEKKPRFRITQQQLERLEALYKQNTHPSRQIKQSLANDVGLPLKNITIWFQNKRQTIRRRSARFAENVEPERAPGPSSNDCGPSTRILLGLTPEPAIPAKDSPSATKERPIKERAATPTPTPISAATYAAPGPRLGQVYMQDLWAYLPSSPPTPTLYTLRWTPLVPLCDSWKTTSSVRLSPATKVRKTLARENPTWNGPALARRSGLGSVSVLAGAGGRQTRPLT